MRSPSSCRTGPGRQALSRRPYAIGATSVYDYPLSSRFDETDSLVVFDDVFVPWEDIFIYRNIELAFGQFQQTAAHVLGNCQAQIRFISKLQFLSGWCKRICESSGQLAKPEFQVALGELATRAALVEALVLASEVAATTDANGVCWPNPSMIYANQTLQATLYPEMLQMARTLMGGSVIQVSSSAAELQNPESAADLEAPRALADGPG